MSAAANLVHRNPVRVYLSHSIVDQVLARKIGNLLSQRANAEVFTTEDLNAGEKWQTKLRRKLESSDVVVALLTPASVDSNWVLHEIGAAWAMEKPIIPMITRRDVLNKMPVPLEGSKVIELSDVDTPEKAEKFVDEFERSLTTSHIA